MEITKQAGRFAGNKQRIGLERLSYDKVLLVGIFIFAAYIRLNKLGEPSLWQDEAHTWWIAALGWADFFETLRAVGVHPPLYFLAAKVGLAVLGENELGLRMLPAIFDLVSLVVAVQIGRSVGHRWGAVAAGWFWACHPMMIWYAGEARPYALALALSTGLLFGYLILSRNVNRSIWLYIFAALVLGLLTHYFFFLLAGALILCALADLNRHPILFRGWALLSLVASLPLALWLAWYFHQTHPSLGIGWIRNPYLVDLPLTMWNLISGFGGRFSISTGLFGVAVGALVITALIGGKKSLLIRRSFLFGILLPLSGVWVLSQRRPIYMDRYFIVLLPFLLLSVASGAARIKDTLPKLGNLRLRRLVAGGIILAMGSAGLWAGWEARHAEQYSREDWRGLVSYLIANSNGNPKVWFSDQNPSPLVQMHA